MHTVILYQTTSQDKGDHSNQFCIDCCKWFQTKSAKGLHSIAEPPDPLKKREKDQVCLFIFHMHVHVYS